MNYEKSKDIFIYMRFFVIFFFHYLGKFGAVFAPIPFPIFAAMYCILFGLVGMSYYHLK